VIASELDLPVARVCRVLEAPRSTIYARRKVAVCLDVAKRGPRTELSDRELVGKIRQVLDDSPFCGEGYRKVRARLRREHGIHAGGKRVLRLMRSRNLLAPQRRSNRRKPRLHDGSITPEAPDVMWGTDGTTIMTTNDGQVWIFATIDHFSGEAWTHVSKVGDRFAALQPVYDAVIDRFGELRADVARGIKIRHDWGSQYRSRHFFGSTTWLGFDDSPAFVGEPQTNGTAERFMRTLKEQFLWSRQFSGVDDLRETLAAWMKTYNNEWLVERLGHRTPKETYAAFASNAA
jgi:putative transposase